MSRTTCLFGMLSSQAARTAHRPDAPLRPGTRRAPLARLSRATCLFALVVACTAPPRPAETPPPAPAPVHRLAIHVDVSGYGPADVDAAAVAPIEAALTKLPDVTALAARAEDGRATLIATVTAPTALEAVRTALEPILPQLPRDVSPPILSRDHGSVAPVLTVAVPLDGPAEVVRHAIERLRGVARVDLCGGHDRQLAIELDRTRLAGVPIDALIAAIEAELANTAPPQLFERLGFRPIGDTPFRVSDVAVVRETLRPRPCTAYTPRGQVLLLTVVPQLGADTAQIVADARAHDVELVSPTPNFFADHLPTPETSGLAVLDLELARRDDTAAALARCLGTADIPPWAFIVPGEPSPARPTDPVHTRLFLATTAATKIEAELPTLSLCTGSQRIAIAAPPAEADHALGLVISGAAPEVLATLADAVAQQVAAVQGVTGLRVLAPRERGLAVEFDRAALADRGLSAGPLVKAMRLALGPVALAAWPDPFTLAPAEPVPVVLDMPNRPGSIDQVLKDIHVQAATGTVTLAELVRTREGELGPLYRFDRQPGVAVDVRLRRAGDREAVQRAVAAGVQLPAGVKIEFGPELPRFAP